MIASLPPVRRMTEALERERVRILDEAVQVRGLMPLLMKHRNGQRWTRPERRELCAGLRSLTCLAPYLVALALPASFATLPLLAWWLDRRRQRRPDFSSPSLSAPPSA